MMTDRNELRRLAEAAASGPWWTSDKLKCHPDLELSDDTAYIAAASPEVVLGLLDSISVLEGWYATVSGQHRAAEAERDQLREEAQHALVIVGNVGRELGQTQHERDQLRAEVDRQKAWVQQMAMADAEHLREVLGIIAEFDPAVTHGWAECVREMARSALRVKTSGTDYRAVAVRLKGVITELRDCTSEHGGAARALKITRAILADPDVEKLK
jgi:hypothetical protein